MIEYYRLDNRFERVKVLEDYSSMLWSERYDAVGSFTIVYSAKDYKLDLTPGTYLGNSKTRTVMRVTRNERSFSSEGVVYTISGYSLQHILSQRSLFIGVKNPNLKYRSTLGNVICKAVEVSLVPGAVYFPGDAIDGFQTLNESGTVEALSVELKPSNLLDLVLELLPVKGLGFEIYPIKPYGFVFRVYDGAKRQNVMMSVDFDNVISDRFISDSKDHKNVAYIWSAEQTRFVVVYANGPSSERDNLDRKVLQVDASDIRSEDYADPALFKEALMFRGYQELAKYDHVRLYDGEVLGEAIEYGSDYFLGDVIRVRGITGNFVDMKLVENTWAHDRDGFKSIPTVRQVG